MAVVTGTAILEAAGIGAATALLSGHRHGGQTVSTTQAAGWSTPKQKQDAQRLWDEFIDDFYDVSPKISPVSTTGIDPRIRNLSRRQSRRHGIRNGARIRNLSKRHDMRSVFPNLANLTGQAPEAPIGPKSYKQRLGENLTYLKGVEEAYREKLDALGAGYLTKTQGAVSPYQEYLRSLPGYVTKTQGEVSPYQEYLRSLPGYEIGRAHV